MKSRNLKYLPYMAILILVGYIVFLQECRGPSPVACPELPPVGPGLSCPCDDTASIQFETVEVDLVQDAGKVQDHAKVKGDESNELSSIEKKGLAPIDHDTTINPIRLRYYEGHILTSKGKIYYKHFGYLQSSKLSITKVFPQTHPPTYPSLLVSNVPKSSIYALGGLGFGENYSSAWLGGQYVPGKGRVSGAVLVDPFNRVVLIGVGFKVLSWKSK